MNLKNACFYHQCPSNRQCVLNAAGHATCVCKQCSKNELDVYAPVCGSDKQTYKSKCDLEHKSCLSQSSVFVNYVGPCTAAVNESTTTQATREEDKCSPNKCDHGERCVKVYLNITNNNRYSSNTSVASSNTTTYNNLNNNFQYICECELCPQPEEINLVCGTDRQTYKNPCLLLYTSCQQKKHIPILYSGECGE
ncbi:Agrin-like protein 3 [Dinothrombium tinctorium]|uniref:Agrin-like protein 3 n=1 Tax=Dinothrombium tinctorium TaxID=1965070 RepID=A0A443RK92_9ACAR|nr:Agrin-like protein 3 [Dinothrombium tinctorium]